MSTYIDALDGFLAFERMKANAGTGRTYPCRERIPEPLLEYADWFVQMTKIEPDRRVINGWIKELTYWQDKGLDLIDLENAWNKSGGGTQFMVTGPYSLSGVAIAMKAKAQRNETRYDESASAYACPICKQITCRCEK